MGIKATQPVAVWRGSADGRSRDFRRLAPLAARYAEPYWRKMMDEKNELKPCPFCGEEARASGDERDGFYVSCGVLRDGKWTGCFAAIGEHYDRDAMPEHEFRSEAEAIAAWNRRAPLPAPPVS